MVQRAKRGNVIYTPAMDKAIIEAWPELATFEGVYPYEIKRRARAIGLRLSQAESRRRMKAGYRQWMGSFRIDNPGDDRRTIPLKPHQTHETSHQSMLFTLEQDRMIVAAWPDGIKNLKFPNRNYMQIYNRAQRLLKRKNRV